jgi:hypothetical protein
VRPVISFKHGLSLHTEYEFQRWPLRGCERYEFR